MNMKYSLFKQVSLQNQYPKTAGKSIKKDVPVMESTLSILDV